MMRKIAAVAIVMALVAALSVEAYVLHPTKAAQGPWELSKVQAVVDLQQTIQMNIALKRKNVDELERILLESCFEELHGAGINDLIISSICDYYPTSGSETCTPVGDFSFETARRRRMQNEDEEAETKVYFDLAVDLDAAGSDDGSDVTLEDFTATLESTSAEFIEVGDDGSSEFDVELAEAAETIEIFEGVTVDEEHSFETFYEVEKEAQPDDDDSDNQQTVIIASVCSVVGVLVIGGLAYMFMSGGNSAGGKSNQETQMGNIPRRV
jgi:hypothetical protein